MQSAPSAHTSLVAGALAALGATACCLGPLLMVTLGIGGVWVSGLRALEPFRPVFTAVGVLFFGMAFHRLYVVQRRCATGETCAVPATLVRQKAACPITVKKAFKKVPGVAEVTVDYKAGTAEVIYDAGKVSPDELAKATTAAGNPTTVKEVH